MVQGINFIEGESEEEILKKLYDNVGEIKKQIPDGKALNSFYNFFLCQLHELKIFRQEILRFHLNDLCLHKKNFCE